jgi:ABC-type thiamine transport system substrate-binding protein
MSKKSCVIFIFASLVGVCNAQTLETNIPNIVVKNYQCYLSGKWLKGNLINRNSESFNGRLRVKIIDSENDIMWQGVQVVKVDGLNGSNFDIAIGVGTCQAPNRVQLTLER